VAHNWCSSGGARLPLPLGQLQYLQSLSIKGEGRSDSTVLLECAPQQQPSTNEKRSKNISEQRGVYNISRSSLFDRGSIDGAYEEILDYGSDDYDKPAAMWPHGHIGAEPRSLPNTNPLMFVASSLTSLTLHGVQLEGFPGGWHCLTALTTLQQLDLQQAADPPDEGYYGHVGRWTRFVDPQLSHAGQLGDALRHLTSLTQLQLKWELYDNCLKDAIGSLSNLQYLRLGSVQHWSSQERRTVDERAADGPLRLLLELTRLELQLPMAVNSSSIPDLPALTSLQHLQLFHNAQIEPSLLSNLTLLTHLEIVMVDDKFNNTHMAALLDVLPKLQQLQHLHIQHSYNHGRVILTVLQEQCSALTSSTNLVRLHLEGMHLPAACGSQLFGHMLPRLKAIHMDLKRPGPNSPATLEHSLVQENVAAIVENCPLLEELVLLGAVQRGVKLGALQRLKHLTSVDFGGDCVDDSCAQCLAQLSSLKQLTIHPRVVRHVPDDSSAEGSSSSAECGSRFTVEGLRSLMQLSSLQEFSIVPLFMVFRSKDGYSSDGYDNDGEFKAPVGSTYSCPWMCSLCCC
jgi:hypothetical protein